MTKNKSEPTLKILSNFLPSAKIPPMFKEAEVLPWRLRNFEKKLTPSVLRPASNYFDVLRTLHPILL